MDENPSTGEPEVFFCDLCQESIPEKDLAEGKALEIQGRRVCRNCRRRLVPPLPSARLAAVLAFLALLAAAGAGTLGLVQRNRLGELAGSQRENFLALDNRARDEFRTLREILGNLRKALAMHEQKLAALEETSKESLRRIRDQASSFQALKKDFFDFRTFLQGHLLDLLDGRLLNLAERFSALETAVKEQGQALEKLVQSLGVLSKKVETGSVPPSPPGSTGGGISPSPKASPQAPDKKDLARFEEILKSSEPDKRWKAVEALEKIPSPETVRLVARVLADPDIWVRRLAAESLGRMGRMEAVGPLIDALADQEAMIRAAALASLKTLTGKSFGFDPNGSPGSRKRALGLWKAWWSKRKGSGNSLKG